MNPIKPNSLRMYLLWHGWIGVIIMVASQMLLYMGNRFVANWLTPIMWTGYIIAIDGLVYRLRGESWLTTRRREFPLLVLVSVGVWLIFEVYNFHLQNWFYHGVPTNPLARDIAYFWSFSTIMPGVFETANLVETLLSRRNDAENKYQANAFIGPSWAWFITGIALITIPLALPIYVATHLFGFVWIGFFLLLDPINEKLGAPSLRIQLRIGNRIPVIALLISGMICGFVWETWNYQAYLADGGHWVYTFPEVLHIFGWHFGKMPVLGLLGFPIFALELFSFYHLIFEMVGGKRVFK